MNINKNNDDYNNLIGFASELKQLTEISNKFNDYSKEDELILIKQFTPGEYMELVYQDISRYEILIDLASPFWEDPTSWYYRSTIFRRLF